MSLSKLVIPPNQSSYAVADGKETLSVKLDGGFSRYRKDISGASSLVNVVWSIGRDEFTYLRAFYNTASVSGAIPFLIDLYLDEPTLTEHEAYFIPETFKLSSQKGLEFTVSAQLEVKPAIPDDDYNQSLVDVYGAYGSFEAAQEVIDQLEILANIDLPNFLAPDTPTMVFGFDSGSGLDPVLAGSLLPSVVWVGPSDQVSLTGIPSPALNEAGDWIVTMDDFADLKSIVADADSVTSLLINDEMINLETLDLSDNPNLNVDLIVNEIYERRNEFTANLSVDIGGTCPIVSAASETKITELEGSFSQTWIKNSYVSKWSDNSATLDLYDDKLESYYKLGEASSTRVDELGNNDLSPTNAPGNRTGKIGNALNVVFGSSQLLENSSFPRNNQLAISIWLLADIDGSGSTLMGALNIGSLDIGFYARPLDTAGGDTIWIKADGGTIQLNDGTRTVRGVWTHWVGIFSGGTAYFYRDNVLIDSAAYTTLRNLGTGLILGRTDNAFYGYFDGGEDELAIWNDITFADASARNAFVNALYNAGNGVTYDG